MQSTSTRIIISRIIITALLSLFFCIIPQHDAHAVDLDVRTSFGVEFTLGIPPASFILAPEESAKDLPSSEPSSHQCSRSGRCKPEYSLGGPAFLLSFEFLIKFNENYALGIEEELGAMLIFPFSSKTLLNFNYSKRWDKFGINLKLGAGFFSRNITVNKLALRAGITLSYHVSETWTVGGTVNYTPVIGFKEDRDCEDLYQKYDHLFGIMFHFTRSF